MREEKLVYLSGNVDDQNFGWNTIKGLTLWITFVSISMFFGFWFSTNGTLEEKATVNFYSIILLTFMSFISIFAIIRIVAWKFFHKKYVPLDFILLNPYNCILNRILGKQVLTTKRLFLIGIVWGLVVAFMIYGTGFKMIGSPTEYVADPLVGKIRSAMLKANPTSPAENLMIFGFFEGIIFILLQKYAKIPWHVAFVITVILIGVVGFPAYHWARYGEKETDLLSVSIWSVSNSAIAGLTGSLLITEIWHEVNNYVGEMRNAKQWGLSVQWGS